MVKTGEITNVSSPEDIDQRPRNLFNPSTELKVIGGFFNYLIIRATKKVLPGFVHALNTGDL